MTGNSVPQYRLCKRCDTEYPLTNEHFSRSKAHAYGLCHTCKPCANAASKVARERDPKKAYENVRRWKLANPKRTRELNMRSLDRNRDSVNERQRKYRSDDIEEARKDGRAKAARRKAKLLEVGGQYTTEDIDQKYEEQDGRCVYCGVSIYWQIHRDVHVDHVQPITRGGTNNPDNLVLTCQSCNLSKHDKTYTEWAAIRGW